jgi:hypothetical protein
MAPEDPITDRLHQAALEERAPAHLRARIEDLTAARASRRRRPVVIQRPAFGLSLAGALAAIALVIVLALPGGTPGAPSISQAATLGALAPDAAAPSVDPVDAALLKAHVGALQFPTWAAEATVVGERTDRLDGRTVTTVYYRQHNQLIAYSIVSGRPLALPHGWNASEYAVARFDGRNLVVWRQGGHTCLVSASRVSGTALLWLARGA